MRKSNFLTFCFAFIPGAGEMYLGMMRKGICIMSLFWGVIGIAALLQMGFLCFVLPVIWFYSFFETLNIKHLSWEEVQVLDHEFSSHSGLRFSANLRPLLEKRHALIGCGLVFLGIWILLSNFAMPILRDIFNTFGLDFWLLHDIFRMIPTVLLSVAIIIFGIYLVKGKKKSENNDDYVEFKGGTHE